MNYPDVVNGDEETLAKLIGRKTGKGNHRRSR